MRTINGKTYEKVPAMNNCKGCAFYDGRNCTEPEVLCAGIIWKEIEMKSALALVEQFRVESGNLSNRDYDQLKAAIEREQDLSATAEQLLDAVEIAANLSKSLREGEPLVAWVKRMIADSESAITMRPILDELQQRDGDTTNTLSNILSHWSPEKQKSLARGIMGENLIEMRPISELPDRVPEGCMLVAVAPGKWWAIGGSAIPEFEQATHFYILPLPVAERKLHPCYMPGCGGAVVGWMDGCNAYVACPKCGARGPFMPTKEEAEEAWGWE